MMLIRSLTRESQVPRTSRYWSVRALKGASCSPLDKGIADVRCFPPRDYAGIVLFRPASTGRGAVLAFARRHLPSILSMELTGWLLVVGERSIRIR